MMVFPLMIGHDRKARARAAVRGTAFAVAGLVQWEWLLIGVWVWRPGLAVVYRIRGNDSAGFFASGIRGLIWLPLATSAPPTET